jgi:hypothetical protein
VRFATSGELRRLDLTPLTRLLPAIWEEWANLQFDGTGALVNPMTSARVDALSLLSGTHRRAGAEYRITVTKPRLELPENRRREFEKDAAKLSRRGADHTGWSDHHARKRAASVQVGVDHEHLRATLIEDSPQRLALSIAAEKEPWTVDVTVTRQRLPRVELEGHIDLTSAFEADGLPGCLAWFIGGRGAGSAVVELGALERNGRAIEAEGHANRFSGDFRTEARTSATTWGVDARGSLRARGLFRTVLWFAGGRVRKHVERTVAEIWAKSDQATADLSAALAQLDSDTEAEGGPTPFVHRCLWDEDFDGGLGQLRIDRQHP